MSYTTIKFDKGRKVLRADYEGGAYIDLTFGSEGHHPIEVINVWNYEDDTTDVAKLEAQGLKTHEALRVIVRNWMADNDEEWPEWYEGYIENSRY